MKKGKTPPHLLWGLSVMLMACGGPTKETDGCPPNCTDVPLCPSGGCVDVVPDPGQSDSTTTDPGIFSDPNTTPDLEDPTDESPDPGQSVDLGEGDVAKDLSGPEELPVEVDAGVDPGPLPDEASASVDEGSSVDEPVLPVDEGSSSDPGTDTSTGPDIVNPPSCTNSAECPGFQSCSVASECISAEICLSHIDCVEGACQEAECTSESPLCDDGEYCSTNGLCDPVFHACVDALPCASNEDCLTGYCDIADGSCFECIGASDCPEAKPLCDDGACIHLGTCVSDAHCPIGEQCQQGGLCGVPLPLDDIFDVTGGNNSPDEAITVNAGSYPNLTIHPSDPDYYKIDIPAGKSLRVAARGASHDAVLAGRLVDRDTGFILAERENLSHFTVLYAPKQNITRHVLLELTNPWGTVGIYGLEVRLDSQSPCLDDVYDLTGNNDTLGKAEVIEDPHTLLIGRTICPDDKDWYQFELATEEELIVWFWGEQGANLPTVALRNDLGNPINMGEVLGDHTIMREDTLPAGTYYLSVVPNDDEETLKYNLQIHRWSKQLCSTDTHEVDDIPWLGLQKPLTGAALTLCANDVDYFPAHTEINEGLVVVVSYNNSFAQIRATVTDVATNEVVAEIINPLGPVGPQVLSVEIAAETEARDFLIKTERTLTNFAGGTGYTLSATPVAELCVDDPFEPNNDKDSAAILSASGPIVQFVFGEMCSNDAADWYSLMLSPGAHLALDILANQQALADLSINLWKEVGGELVSAASPTASASGLGLSASVELSEGEIAQNIYVEIQSSQTQSYSLFPIIVGESACSDDPEEPDNTPLTGREIIPGGTLSGTLCMSNPDLVHFTWDSSMSTNPVISGTNTGGTIKIYMNIRNSALEPIASPKLQAPGPEANTVLDLTSLDLEDGIYFIELTSLFPVSYVLSW